MADVQAILALVARGWSYRRIGRETPVRAGIAAESSRMAPIGSVPRDAMAGIVILLILWLICRTFTGWKPMIS